MDLVTRPRFAVCVLLTAVVCLPASACDVDRWQPHIAEASRKYDVPEIWIRAVMQAESAGCASLGGRPIRSSAGAMGLMQLMPATWVELRRQHGLGEDPDDPRNNVLAGTAYLRELADRFGAPGAFAAYNAGPARYAEHLLLGRPLPPETRRYLAQVSSAAGIVEVPTLVANHLDLPPVDPLFAVNGVERSTSHSIVTESLDERLFVRLRHGRNRHPESESTDAQE